MSRMDFGQPGDPSGCYMPREWWRPHRAPPNTHPNPLSGYSEDYPDPEDIEAELENSVGLGEQP